MMPHGVDLFSRHALIFQSASPTQKCVRRFFCFSAPNADGQMLCVGVTYPGTGRVRYNLWAGVMACQSFVRRLRMEEIARYHRECWNALDAIVARPGRHSGAAQTRPRWLAGPGRE